MLSRLHAVRDISASVIRATSGRCMFITIDGYAGLAPVGTQLGACVAILLGGSTPFMQRESYPTMSTECQHTLVGDCYVHGWMDGQRMKHEIKEDWPYLILTLCKETDKVVTIGMLSLTTSDHSTIRLLDSTLYTLLSQQQYHLVR